MLSPLRGRSIYAFSLRRESALKRRSWCPTRDLSPVPSLNPTLRSHPGKYSLRNVILISAYNEPTDTANRRLEGGSHEVARIFFGGGSVVLSCPLCAGSGRPASGHAPGHGLAKS